MAAHSVQWILVSADQTALLRGTVHSLIKLAWTWLTHRISLWRKKKKAQLHKHYGCWENHKEMKRFKRKLKLFIIAETVKRLKHEVFFSIIIIIFCSIVCTDCDAEYWILWLDGDVFNISSTTDINRSVMYKFLQIKIEYIPGNVDYKRRWKQTKNVDYASSATIIL